MTKSWGSSSLGELFTSSKPWELSLDGERFALVVHEQRHAGDILALEKAQVSPGVIWSSVHIQVDDHWLDLDGIPNARATEMRQAFRAAIRAVLHRQHIAQLMLLFDPAVASIVDWHSKMKAYSQQQILQRGWLSHEFSRLMDSAKPRVRDALFSEPEIQQHLSRQPPPIRSAVSLWQRPFENVAAEINSRHKATELTGSRAFFDAVEKSPLTPEQSEAVICFDNRVLLVASAGSGKTSTMVAKAAYALHKRYFAAPRILLLAFNADAAAELRERIRARLAPLGLPWEGIVAKTFHAFGLDVLGAADGKKPSVAPWIESGRDHEAIVEIVDQLKDADPAFRSAWDMFRLVFGQDLPEFGKEADDPDSWDRDSGKNGFRTLNNEIVKSRGELVIANWLFYNGIRYQYEAPYKVDVADAQHRQYRPDFYFPEIDTYLEHWGLDSQGNPPPGFHGYRAGMAWKKQTHATQGTRLLETTTADLWSGKVFGQLERQLTELGVVLDPNPDRVVPGREPLESPRLAKTLRAFLTHVKSNRLSVDDIRRRLEGGVAGQFRYRHELFLNLFEKIWYRWEARLKDEGYIDFDDMLNQAADRIEQGAWDSPYELVMVDEFQDASRARTRLIAGLVAKPGRHLFAVGDDWQSINRFAGADLSVMTEFESTFGKAVTLKLETTFRCPQSLCDISSRFIQKNPKQLRKSVRSPVVDIAEPIRIVRAADERQIRSTIESRLAEIAAEHGSGDCKTKVYLLGRYRREREYLPQRYDTSRLQLEFTTAHAAKGLEADHVIVPRVTSEIFGFPSRVEDDPVLQLAMPAGDSYEFAEERRLFYVAMTRARRTVTLVTLARKESSFISELIRESRLEVRNSDGSESSAEVCPGCGEGFLTFRRGPYGPFLGCTRFPKCMHKRKLRP